jgi:hypothetical protein
MSVDKKYPGPLFNSNKFGENELAAEEVVVLMKTNKLFAGK